MPSRSIAWLRSNPWRGATIVLTIALVGLLALYLTRRDPGTGSEDEDPGAIVTTTAPVGSGSPGPSTTMGDGGPSPSGEGFLAVKVDNAPSARPQVGINSASLLVEVPVEGGMTRFVAVFAAGASGLVGPIRSLRPVDADLLPPLAVQVVSTGGQPFVVQAVDSSGIDIVDPTIFSLFVSGGRQVPSDTFLDLEVLMPLIEGTPPEGKGLPSGVLPSSSESASTLALPLGGVELRLEDGVYARYQDGEPYQVLDTLDGPMSVLAHETVVVMFVAERPAGYQDSNGAEVPTFDVIGGGRLLVAHNGQLVRGTWSRTARADPFVFRDLAGEPFGLPVGSTYLAMVPRDMNVEVGP
ncbi:MAG: DUF3048 domain-containing protein [Acidimicrobiia bacterium]